MRVAWMTATTSRLRRRLDCLGWEVEIWAAGPSSHSRFRSGHEDRDDDVSRHGHAVLAGGQLQPASAACRRTGAPKGRCHPGFGCATGSHRQESDHVGAYRLCERVRPGRAWTHPEPGTPRGGNITGLATTSADLAGKRLELLRELVRKLRRVAVLWDPSNPTNPIQLKGVEVAARTLGLQLQPAPVQGPSDFDAAFKAARGANGLLLLDTPLVITHRARLAGLAATGRLPAISGLRDFVEVGGLMSYGVDFPDSFRRAATYVDKILRGAKPADLPVEQPTSSSW